MGILRFYVYKHVFVLHDDRKITRFFITLRDNEKHILTFTNFHKFINVGKNKQSVRATSSGEFKFYALCSFLNYVFFESKYNPTCLNDITTDMISEYLNDYGLARLNENDKIRSQNTVDRTISALIDFFENYLNYTSRNMISTKLKKSDLYKKVKRFSKKQKKYIDTMIPAFKVSVIPKEKTIFRDIFEGAFEILMNTAITEFPDILMLIALSAFAGLRPSEACNVFRPDSPLGEGIRFIEYNGKVDDIIIDLSHERNLRSDFKSVGDIKKERMQRVYPAFIGAFMRCYNFYMSYMDGAKFEADYAPLTVNKQGKAMTYISYYDRFKHLVESARNKMLLSEDPKVVAYGKHLFTTNLGPHIFRHWFSVKLTLFGEDVAGLMYWRGDSSPQSALTYIGNKSELVKQLEDVSSKLYDFSMWMGEKKYDGRP